jgi:hypothetical protein
MSLGSPDGKFRNRRRPPLPEPVSGTSSRRPALLWGGAGLLIAVAIVVLLASQGSGGGGGALNAIAEAAVATQREAGGHMTMRATMTSPDRPKPLVMTGSMFFNGEGDSNGVVTAANPEGGEPVVVHMVAVGRSMYVRSSEFGKMNEEGKWLGMVMPADGESSGPVPSQTDAGQELEALEEATGAEKVGTEKVRGVATTRYRGSLKGGGPIEVWIDGENHIRQTRIVITKAKSGATQPTRTVMTMNYYGYGPVPAIKPPDPSDVIDGNELVENGPAQ